VGIPRSLEGTPRAVPDKKQMHLLLDYWRRCDRNEVQITVHVRQMAICLGKMPSIVGLSLRR
jgi:hypothetical protein